MSKRKKAVELPGALGKDWDWAARLAWFRRTVREVIAPVVGEEHGANWNSREAFERCQARDFFADAEMARLPDSVALEVWEEEIAPMMRRFQSFREVLGKLSLERFFISQGWTAEEAAEAAAERGAGE